LNGYKKAARGCHSMMFGKRETRRLRKRVVKGFSETKPRANFTQEKPRVPPPLSARARLDVDFNSFGWITTKVSPSSSSLTAPHCGFTFFPQRRVLLKTCHRNMSFCLSILTHICHIAVWVETRSSLSSPNRNRSTKSCIGSDARINIFPLNVSLMVS
jgi:hypothetical protein